MFSASNSVGVAGTPSGSSTSSQGNGVDMVIASNTSAAIENQQWASATRRSVTFAEPLHANAPDFSPMKQLNRGSEPDGQNYTANTGRVLRPIGSPTGDHRSVHQFYEGPVFSTDVDMAVHGGRYVEISQLPAGSMDARFLEHLFTRTAMHQQLKGHQAVQDFGGFVRLFLFFDDLRAAKKSETTFARILPGATFRFITLDEYFAVDQTHWRAQLRAEFDGQVQFVAKQTGLARDSSVQLMYNVVRSHAQTYGEVRTIALQQPCKISEPRFRVEYFKISHADRACEVGNFVERLELDHGVLASCEEFSIHGLRGPFHRRRVVPSPQQSQRDLDLQTSMHDMSLGNHGGHYAGHVSRRGPTAQQLHDEAPEYRNRGSRGRPQPFVPSGIHDDIDFDVLRRSGPENIYKQPQTITLDRYGQTNDVRTTVMVRNIPNRLEARDLNAWLDETSKGLYDFSYLRVDFSNNCNVGYAFVNFVSAEAVADFVSRREKKLWGLYSSDKTCEVSYATIQGQDCLIEKFRNSSVMQEWRGYRPKMWYSIDTPNRPAENNVGDEAPFPPPNNQSKLQRSLDNARNIGLYPPRHNMLARGRDSHPNRRSQYDRGTPRALLEDHAFANEVRGQTLVEYRGDAPAGARLYYVVPNQYGDGQQDNSNHNRGYNNHGPNRGGNQNRGRGGNGRRRHNNNHNNHYRGNDNY